MYGSFCKKVGRFLDLYAMFCDWIYDFKGVWFKFGSV